MKFEVILSSDNKQMKLLSNEILKQTKSPVKLLYWKDNEIYNINVGSPKIWLLSMHGSRNYRHKYFEDYKNGSRITKKLTNTYVNTALIMYVIESDDFYYEADYMIGN